MQEEISIPVKEEPNPIVVRQKRTKKILATLTPVIETLKGRGRQKAMILKETPIRSHRMRGQISKESTSSKPSTKEFPVQIVSDNSPSHPKITNIPKNPNEECRVEVNKN